MGCRAALPAGPGDFTDPNTDGDNDETTVTGTIAGLPQFQSGADEPLSFSLVTDTSALEAQNLTSGGVALTYSLVGNVLTATAGPGGATVFTFTLNPGGAWVFDLEDQLDHAPGAAENDLTIFLGSQIQATDFDGDIAPGGAVQITVNDDTPIAAVEPQVVSATVVEDALLTTAPGDTGDLSDGNLDAGQDNSGDEASGLAGSLTTLFEEGADEPLTYTLSTDTSGLPTLFSKGDAVSYAVVVNDNGTPADPSDDISTLTATAGGRTVFTLVVNADGSWTFDLDDQLDHVDASGDSGFNLITAADGSTSVPSIDFSSILVATDFDGDSATGAASGSFTIAVENDIPQIVGQPAALQVDEDALGDANTDTGQTGEADFGGLATDSLDLTTFFSVGADEPGTYQFTSGAAAALDALLLTSDQVLITNTLVGDTITGSAGVNPIYTIQVTAGGTLNVTLLDHIDHVDNPDDTETNLTISLGSLIEVVDEDGDALSAPSGDITLNIGDDIPNAVVVINTPDTLVLDETRPVGTETDGDSAPAGLDTVTANFADNFGRCRTSAATDLAARPIRWC